MQPPPREANRQIPDRVGYRVVEAWRLSHWHWSCTIDTKQDVESER